MLTLIRATRRRINFVDTVKSEYPLVKTAYFRKQVYSKNNPLSFYFRSTGRYLYILIHKSHLLYLKEQHTRQTLVTKLVHLSVNSHRFVENFSSTFFTVQNKYTCTMRGYRQKSYWKPCIYLLITIGKGTYSRLLYIMLLLPH